ncbi:rap guanine nucleotide exchange factor 4-like [Carcharodon carcharias]|uniref:rap guanine nucleotide exchange factor 4-like n=1 Tax=Carcharodon carcharias TaxID=13397 RepID=UPI001B7F494C|nr:rap guanine nucleotide exchange factor 4-like [Carcharodon carcharias]
MPVDTSVQDLISILEEDCVDQGGHVMVQLSSAGDMVELRPNDRCVYTSMGLNDRLYFCTREQRETLAPHPEQQQPSSGTHTTLEVFSSKELANHLTEYDWELFNCVHEVELIRYIFGERAPAGGTTANLERYLQRFNTIQYWTATEICLCLDLGKRTLLLKKFIKMAAW